jgi:Glycosyl transferases group 1
MRPLSATALFKAPPGRVLSRFPTLVRDYQPDLVISQALGRESLAMMAASADIQCIIRAVEIYSSTSLLLMPSQWEEAFGRVALEACANGIPVVVSKIEGIPEAVCMWATEGFCRIQRHLAMPGRRPLKASSPIRPPTHDSASGEDDTRGRSSSLDRSLSTGT